MKQITFLHFSAPPQVGGIENILYHHIRLFNAAGYRVQVIAGEGEEAYFEASFHHQVEFHRLPEMDPENPEVLEAQTALEAGDLSHFEALRDLLVAQLQPKLAKVDVCLVHDLLTWPRNLALTAALHPLRERLGKTSFLAWCHHVLRLEDPILPAGQPWDLVTTPLAGVCYIVPSQQRRLQLAEQLGLAPEVIAVVPPGIDEAVLFKWEPTTYRLVQELHLLQADPLILLPAQLKPRKNILFALQVTAELQRLKPKATLVVSGLPRHAPDEERTYLDELNEQRQALGLAHQAHFLFEYGEYGLPLQITTPVLFDLYTLADVLLFPSYEEPFGLPVLEGGLMRLPVFAADLPPIRESTRNLAHYFDPYGDPARVAQAIADFTTTDTRHTLRQHILQEYTWDGIFTRLLQPLIENCQGSDEARA